MSTPAFSTGPSFPVCYGMVFVPDESTSKCVNFLIYIYQLVHFENPDTYTCASEP